MKSWKNFLGDFECLEVVMLQKLLEDNGNQKGSRDAAWSFTSNPAHQVYSYYYYDAM